MTNFLCILVLVVGVILFVWGMGSSSVYDRSKVVKPVLTENEKNIRVIKRILIFFLILIIISVIFYLINLVN